MALHNWDVTPEEAIAIQQRLRTMLHDAPPIALDSVHTVAGIDASYTDVGRAAVVVLTYPDLQLVEQVTAVHENVFPYIPGLLAFREGPVVEDAMRKLTVQPDLLMFDGQGYAHPRRMGLACHMGLYLDRPSVGCAKSRLVGRYADPGPNAGDRSPLIDHGETIGVVLRSKPRTNPLFISHGYKMTLENSLEVIMHCLRGYRLPEPTRLADKLAGLT